MSNGSYERFGKLLAMLGKIVYDDRRHLDTVCAKLQSLVFDKFEWPKNKDWNGIRIVASQNQAMAALLANLDLNDENMTTRQIISAFPQCFREEAQVGTVPLSCIRAMAVKNARLEQPRFVRENYTDEMLAEFPHSYGVLDELNLPYFEFATSEKSDRWNEIEQLPDLGRQLKQGDQMVLGRHRGHCVVVEHNQTPGMHEIVLVPERYIDITC